jgi:hypothetical protein
MKPTPEALDSPDIGVYCSRAEVFSVALGEVFPGCFTLQSDYEAAEVVTGDIGNVVDTALEVGKEAKASLYVCNGAITETSGVCMELVAFKLRC